MKGILEFDLDSRDEEDRMFRAMEADRIYGILWDIRNILQENIPVHETFRELSSILEDNDELWDRYQ